MDWWTLLYFPNYSVGVFFFLTSLLFCYRFILLEVLDQFPEVG